MATVVQTYKIRADAGQASREVKGLTRKMGGLKTAMSALAVVAGAGMFARFIKEIIDVGDRVQKISIQLGASTEAMSQLAHAAKITGTDFESVAKSMKYLQRTSAEAADGMAEYADAYAALGINVETFMRLKPVEQFEMVAEAISRVGNQSRRTQLAMQIMGRSGGDMLPLMEDGARGVRKLRDEAHELGLTLDRETADGMAQLNDDITKMKGLWTALGTEIARITVGPLSAFFEVFSDGIKRLRGDFSEQTGDLAELNDAIGDVAANYEELERARNGRGLGWERKSKQVIADLLAEQVLLEQRQRRLQEAYSAKYGFSGGGKPDPLPDVNPDDDDGSGTITDAQRRAAAIFKATRTPLERYKADLVELNELLSTGAVNQDTYNRALEQAFKPLADAQAQAEASYQLMMNERLVLADETAAEQLRIAQELADDEIALIEKLRDKERRADLDIIESAEARMEHMRQSMEDVLGDSLLIAMRGQYDSILDMWVSMIDQMIAKAIAADLINKLMNRSGGGSFVDKAFDFAADFLNLKGYASGGSFTVGGAGGTDSKLVAFRATPGETVSVTTPQQSARVVVNMTVNTPDADSFRRSQGQILSRMQGALASAGRLA